MSSSAANVSTVLDRLNNEFLQVHTAKEDLFWEAKMGLTDNAAETQRRLSTAEIAAQEFNQNADTLRELRMLAASEIKSDDERKALQGWINFFAANVIEEKRAQNLAKEIVELEGTLQTARGGMNLGYMDPTTGEFVPATSTLLSNMIRVEGDENMRRAAWEGLSAIETFVIEKGFLEIVKKRNELGRMLGYEDYYDMKVQRTEGFTKKKLFELLDDLEVRTRAAAKRASEEFAAEKGDGALDGWNFSHYRSGDLAKEIDPYYPFSHSLEWWVRSFAALNIRYRGATLKLDLIDRKGKYENGFMHGPVPSFYNNGAWNPARVNFTANAMPNQVGAGPRALDTLFHEGGHAAHFSNILMNAPCFGQEFAPTSVAYAETQSMFCDSILSDADWRTRYTSNKQGEHLPWSLIERQIEKDQPFDALTIRSMLTVCYVEKALYEMSPDQLTGENVLAMIRRIERELQFLNSSPRPVLAVPHLLAGESSAYYHGYVLAEMAVEQTREYFFQKYGYITDNPNVGPALAEFYWAPGNSENFMDLVERLTGKPFSADALVTRSSRTSAEALDEAKMRLERLKDIPVYDGPLDLDADVTVVHGNETICYFTNGTFEQANEAFVKWVEERYPASA